VAKYTGLDRIVADVFARLGNLQAAWLVGDYASGRDTGIVDTILVGDVSTTLLQELIQKAEKLVERRIRYLVCSPKEWNSLQEKNTFPRAVLLWKSE